jgi:hypothetical protein
MENRRAVAISVALVSAAVIGLRAATSAGRQQLRERTAVEHPPRPHRPKAGPTCAYRGIRGNLSDLRGAAAVVNLETIHRAEPIVSNRSAFSAAVSLKPLS